MKKDILFFGLHRPNRSPSQRYRIEQFLPYLDQRKVSYDYDFLLNEKRDALFYSPGKLFGKAYILFYSLLKLTYIAFFKASSYKQVFVQREAFMLGTAFFEKQISKRTRLIFDFDDSIWMQNVSQANKRLSFLKNAAKTSEIIACADLNIVGNTFLLDYAKQYSEKNLIIPTCVDTEEYKRTSELKEKNDGKVCIGWSGSLTTIEHFKLAYPYIKMLKKKFGERIYFKVLGDANFSDKELDIRGVQWTRETEINELEEFDIGIMPLPEDEWSKGKCGLKGLVYMAMEIPAVMQNHGANKDILQNGKEGFLCSDKQEWVDCISELIENADLRIKLGQAGRKRILESYSIESQKDKFLVCLGML